MRKIVPLMAAICLASLPASAAYAAEPTIDQVHAAAASGQVGQALSMMSEVLKDHPGSAKAHYVEAELYAREGHLSAAESELTKAQQLAPGLPFARSQAVSQLSQELNGGGSAQSAQSALTPVAAPHASWLPIAMLGAAAFGALYLLRRRSALAPGPFGGRPVPFVANPGIGAGNGAPASPWGGYASGGAGSGLLGSLAGGVAMGAGFAAGEEIVDHMFGGGERRAGAGSEYDPGVNQDMGGADFGISNDSSWDDGASGSDSGW